MTRREREQVVELLRCAADLYETRRNRSTPTREAATGETGYGPCDDPIRDKAWKAIYALEFCEHGDGSFTSKLLEAALRVEQGEWP